MMIKRTRGRPRRGRRGLTLIEIVIGTLIAVFLTSAAVIFASHETKLLGFSQEQVEMQQSARTALDLLARDIELAGAGLGYMNCTPATCNPAPVNPAGGPRFIGLQTGAFTALGPAGVPGLAFNTNPATVPPNGNTIIALRGSEMSNATAASTYGFPTHDLGILMADEQRLTIAFHSGLAGEVCDAGNSLPLNQNVFAIMRSEDLLRGRSTRLRATNGAALGNCSFGACGPNLAGGGQGCRTFMLDDDPWDLWNLDDPLGTENYPGGELAVGLKQVIWWVENDAIPQDSHRANLRRAELGFNTTTGTEQNCPVGALSRRNCGGEVAYNVETLHYEVWRFDPTPNLSPGGNQFDDARWSRVPPGPIDPPLARPNERSRLRVDVELVVRARMPDEKLHQGVRVTIPGLCMPGASAMPATISTLCPQVDKVQRRVHRISVEVRNSARIEQGGYQQ